MRISRNGLVGPILLLLSVPLFSQTTDLEQRLDAIAQKVQTDMQIQTGFAVGIVKDGELILQKRYGYLNAEKKTPLAPDTPFYIASTTKSFVALLTVILADKGFLELDAPISKYLPELTFEDKRLQADKITMRMLLNHTHGIDNNVAQFNTAFSGLKISDAELLGTFRRDSALASTGNNFSYSNTGYVLAGLVIKKTTGKSWQENLVTHVLKPAKLNATSPYVSSFAKDKLPAAHSSNRRERGFAVQPFIKVNATMHAAGGTLATISDASKWLILNMDRGRYHGRQVFPEKYFSEILRPQADLKATFFNYERTNYGLGWYHAKMDKYAMLHSFGGFLGARSHISFLPEQRVGVVAMIDENARGASVPDIIANYAYGLVLNDPNLISATDAQVARQVKTFQEAIAQSPAAEPKVQVAADEMAKYAGRYSNASLGELTVKVINGRIYLELGNIKTFADFATARTLSTGFPYGYNFGLTDAGIEFNLGRNFLFAKVAPQK